MARERVNDGTNNEWISGRDLDDFLRKIKGYKEKKKREESEDTHPPIPLPSTRRRSHDVFGDPSDPGSKGKNGN
ncbi:MAG: hypothetical protein ACREHC_02055 [Candidatus Levyibacteriota bacterium]